MKLFIVLWYIISAEIDLLYGAQDGEGISRKGWSA